jgi:hypothetical protein
MAKKNKGHTVSTEPTEPTGTDPTGTPPAPIEPSGSDPGDETNPPPANVVLVVNALQEGLQEAINLIKLDARDRGLEFVTESSELTQRLVEVAAWPVSQAKIEKLQELQEQYRLITLSSQLGLVNAQRNAAMSVVNVAVKLASNSLLAVLA